MRPKKSIDDMADFPLAADFAGRRPQDERAQASGAVDGDATTDKADFAAPPAERAAPQHGAQKSATPHRAPVSRAAESHPRFDVDVPAGGYAWWYIDALSDDGRYGLTTIAFIGSVFSPYYADSGRHDPANHCALNVALYGGDTARWAMTERGRRSVENAADYFRLRDSALFWDGDSLRIHVNERTAPFPRRLLGEIRVTPIATGARTYAIDRRGVHRWRPYAPFSRIELAFKEPNLKWAGYGYFDLNSGDEPLEDAFKYWDWSRTMIGNGETVIYYNTDYWDGPGATLALKMNKSGDVTMLEAPPERRLPSTPIFRIPRRTRAANADGTRVVRTLEDTPFYSRSIIESRVFGGTRRAVHESLLGGRLKSRVVKTMLPFRMPREP